MATSMELVDERSFGREQGHFDEEADSGNQPHQEQGIPVRKRRITRQDAQALAIMVVCCTLSLTTILNSRVAFTLGQIYQLVVIGLLLSVMGTFFQGRFRDLLINIEARHLGSRLQNYDAVLRNDIMADHASLLIRVVLGMLFGLPLGLSAAYKVFTGGSTTFNTNLDQVLQFGLVGAPGAQQLGNGISLMVNSTLPFFEKPLTSSTYGYNMKVGSNATAMFLDAPMPDTVADLRQSLRDDEVLELSARVNGSVSSYLPISSASIGSPDLAASALDWNATEATDEEIPLYPGFFALLHDWVNYTNICVAAYNGTNIFTSGTFSDKIRCINTQRASCNGSWEISRSSAVLLNAECDDTTSSLDQTIIAANFMQLNTFADLLAECITHPTNYYLQNSNNDSVDLIVPAVAGALWSRIVSLNGNADGPGVGATRNLYPGVQYGITPLATSLRYPTLHRQWALLLIVSLYPVLTLVIIVVRASCYFSTPVDQGFGIVALLAGVEPRSLQSLRGASLSGRTRGPVAMKIRVVEVEKEGREDFGTLKMEKRSDDDDSGSMGKIRYLIGMRGRADRIRGGGGGGGGGKFE